MTAFLQKKHLPYVKRFSEEWAILQFLKKWKADNIAYAIENDVSLLILLKENAGSRLAKFFISTVGHNENLSPHLNTENILLWFQVRRPDLHAEIIKSEKGVNWLTSNFEDLKQFFNI